MLLQTFNLSGGLKIRTPQTECLWVTEHFKSWNSSHLGKIKRSVHGKFNFINANFYKTQPSIYVIQILLECFNKQLQILFQT